MTLRDHNHRGLWLIGATALVAVIYGCDANPAAPPRAEIAQADVDPGNDTQIVGPSDTSDPLADGTASSDTRSPDTRSDTRTGGGDTNEVATSCNWASDGAACHPLSPRDMFDIDAIRAMSLDQLKWTVEGTEMYMGVQVIKGAFSGGMWDTYTREGQPKTIELDYVAAVYVPEDWPRPDDPPAAYVSAVHFETNLLQPIAAQIARYFRVPVLHAGHRNNWSELGYSSRATLHRASTNQVIAHNPCEPVDVGRGFFPVAMAQADMHAITLAQRLAEAAGGQINEVAFRGFSKEGHAGWLLAAVDPRVTVAALGGYHNQDSLQSAQIRMNSWGCYGNPAEGRNDPTGPQVAGIVPDWYANTAAGAAFLNAFDTQHNKDLLYPRFILLDGDVGMLDMHDDLFALGAETPFLDGLTEVSWRYVRKGTHTNGATDEDGDEVSKAVVPGLLVENLIGGAGSEADTYPQVLSGTASLDGDTLTVEASASGPTTAMALWWSWSDDLTWNDPEQVGWREVHMVRDGTGWRANVPGVPAGKVVGWYVEARNTVTIGQTDRTRTDAAPVRFINPTQRPECTPQLPDWCNNPDFSALVAP